METLEFSDDNKYLLERLNEGESTYSDFKHTINEKDKIAKSIVAFANQKGGSLFIGVDDNGEIIGCNVKSEYHRLMDILNDYCKPTPSIECLAYTIEGNDVLEIIIEEGDQKPYTSKNKKDKWNIYLRVNDECIKINS